MTLMQFLIGLDECYQPVRSALLIRDPLPDVKHAYNIVAREESNRVVPKSSNVLFQMEILLTVCKNCRKIRHTVERCYDLIGFPPGFKKFANNSNNAKQSFNANVDVKCDKQSSVSPSSSGFTFKQMKKLFALINANGSSNFHANMVGANQHLTVSIVGMFSVVNVFSLNITVGHPNGTLATISHIGNLKSTNNVVLYDVLVVLGYFMSLLSVNKLTRDSKMFVGFDEEKCYNQDLTRKKILGTGTESGGFYLLGHNADQVLATLHSDLKISKSSYVPICEGGILLRFWSDCVLSVVYLINRLPSYVLNRRDVKFDETVFPFKMKTYSSKDLDSDSESDHLSFFDNLRPQSPNDEGRTSSVEDGSSPLPKA
ncbi:hypothetical protein Tco_1371753 [Tanacetum coccineum]